MQETAQVASESSPALRFLGAVLRPIVRLCMRLGVSANQANDLMRWLFVDEFYKTENLWHRRQPFASRAALLSGLSRKEVGRLRDVGVLEDAVLTDRHNRALRVLEGWRHDKRFQDENGKPRPLPLKSGESMTSFHALVSAYSGDVPPRTVLDELRRANCVTEDGETIVPTEAAYGPYAPIEDFLSAASLIIGALGDTTDFNTANSDKDERRLMRAWYQRNIPEENLAAAQRLVQESTIAYGRKLDAELAQLAHKKRDPDKTYVRAGLGAFYFEE